MSDVIFEPLQFRNLTVKNRLFRSSISGRWDNYNGSGNIARINWEENLRGAVWAPSLLHLCQFISAAESCLTTQ